MIKFFRRIRQKLLTESRFGSYLLYAIGEIVLVVIGILIALQINNWNEEQKQQRLEQEYYCRLSEDVTQDKEQMSILLGLAQERLEASNQSVRLLLDENSKKVEVGQLISLSLKAVYSDFQPNNSAYEDLKSGANLNIISDKSVIKALNHYFNRVEELKSIIMVNGKYAVDLSFRHTDNFANGTNQASIANGRFSKGLDEDLKKAFPIDEDELLKPEMRERLLGESLEYVSVNTRQVELYSKLLDEIIELEGLLGQKCERSSVTE
ncbi:DUF6090 family protein [Cryomorphaceae bacterium 1068]|nr:DUF6090 family protein [Cryomorphaceae bacterium 1068]